MMEKIQGSDPFIILLGHSDSPKAARGAKEISNKRGNAQFVANTPLMAVQVKRLMTKRGGKGKLGFTDVASFWNDTAIARELETEGVSKKVYATVKERYVLTNDDFKEVFGSTWRTISNKSDFERIAGRSAERAVDLMALWDQGVAYFGSDNTFLAWINKPSMYFNDKAPIDYLDSHSGIKLIREEIYKLHYSLTA